MLATVISFEYTRRVDDSSSSVITSRHVEFDPEGETLYLTEAVAGFSQQACKSRLSVYFCFWSGGYLAAVAAVLPSFPFLSPFSSQSFRPSPSVSSFRCHYLIELDYSPSLSIPRCHYMAAEVAFLGDTTYPLDSYRTTIFRVNNGNVSALSFECLPTPPFSSGLDGGSFVYRLGRYFVEITSSFSASLS